MKQYNNSQSPENNELYKAAHMMILLSYTLFSVILIGEYFVMSWEKWPIVLIVAGLSGSWIIHIRHVLDDYARLWIYSCLMMITYFLYGTHLTSTFDLATIMVVVIMIFTTTGFKSLISLCQVAFFITFIFDIVSLRHAGELTTPLEISRAALHVGMIIMAGWIGRTIIDKWNRVIGHSHEEIEILTEQTDRLNNFLANLSHEIRTPINAVMGLSSVLEKEDLSPSVSESITAISRAGHRVAEQMGDILDYTEIDMDRLSVTRENYMIGSLINDVLAQLSFADDYGVDLVIDMEADIPAELTGDAAKIKKILWHLIVNGYKFTKEGGVYVHLYPIKRKYGINLILEVKDTGIGIAEDELEYIYDGFYQTDSGRARTVGGLGLGLSIVNGFVKAMSGVMSIESTVQGGTTVRISLPQTVDDPEPCLSVRDKENCHVAGFLGFMTTGSAGVREYYMEMISNLIKGLKVPFQRVQSMGELKSLVESTQITHLFVGTGEYLENREYIDRLTERMNVAVVADRGFNGDVHNRITLLAKPFYGGQVANFLNHAFAAGTFRCEEKMLCPGLKALVVDDEPMNLLVAKGIFEAYGMEVSTAPGGEESISMCHENDYDIVFMDHMMPGMDGVEAMRRLRADASRRNKEFLIVALTANAISSAREMFLSEGFDGFVSKPIELPDLERVLKRILPKEAIEYQKIDNIPGKSGIKPHISGKGGPAPASSGETGGDRLAACGLDVSSGLKYCNGERDFFDRLLLEYASDRENKISTLEELYDSECWTDYAIRVHAIKSTSKMIGAFELSDLALKLEEAAKEGNAGTIGSLHPDLIGRYGNLLNAIHDHYEHPSDQGADSSPDEDSVFEFAPDGGSDITGSGGIMI